MNIKEMSALVRSSIAHGNNIIMQSIVCTIPLLREMRSHLIKVSSIQIKSYLKKREIKVTKILQTF